MAKRIIEVDDQAQQALRGNHCEKLIVDYPILEDSDPVEWWKLRAKEDAWTHDEIGEKMGYDGSVISKVFSGKYTGDIGRIWDAAADAREMVLGSEQGAYINTISSQLIAEALSDSCGRPYISVLTGDAGTGKSFALNRFVNITHRGKALLITIDQTASVSSIVAELGIALNVDLTGQAAIKVRRISDELRHNKRLLIFDEVNNLAFNANRASRIMNTIRQINDLSRCGVVLCGTSNLFDMIFHRNRAQMEMIRSRVRAEVKLPAAGKQEIEALLTSHFGEVSNKSWSAFESGLEKEKHLMGVSGGFSLRRADIIISQIHLLAKKNRRVGKVKLSPNLVNEAFKLVRQK